MDIIFDLDGTLWDTSEIVLKAWNKFIKVQKEYEELEIPENYYLRR